MSSLTRNGRQVLRVIIAGLLTYVTARLLRHFALEVGFESLYYPLAGMAVLARQFWGTRGLYGCVIGLALALGIPAGQAMTAIPIGPAQQLLAACVIALLTAAQAALAVVSLRRVAAALAVDRLHLSSAVLLVCAGAMLLGTLHPLASMALSPERFPILPFKSTPALWGAWIADTLSLLMAAPVVLLWQLHRLDNEAWVGPRRNAGVVIMAAAIAACLLSLLVYQQQATLARVRHDAQTTTLRDELQSEMAATVQKMEAIAAYLSVNEHPDVQEYDRFASQIMRESPVLLGLGIALPVQRADRAEAEALLSREYGRPITFLDYMNDGDTRASAQREDYWPVTRLVPQVRQGVIGFDESFEPGRRRGLMDALRNGVGATPLIRTIKRDRAHQPASFLFKYIEHPYPAIILSPIHIDALLDNCPMARPLLNDGYGIELHGNDGGVLLSRNMPDPQARSLTSHFNPVYSLRLGKHSQWRLQVASPLTGLPFLREPLWWVGQILPQLLSTFAGVFLLATTLRERKLVQLQRQFAAFAAQPAQAHDVEAPETPFDQLIQSGWDQRAFVPWFQPVVDMRTGAPVAPNPCCAGSRCRQG